MQFKSFIENQLTLDFDKPAEKVRPPVLTSISRYDGYNVLRVNIGGKVYDYMVDSGVESDKIIKQFNIPGAEFRALNALKKVANVI